MNTANILIAEKQDTFVLKLVGDVRLTVCQGLDTFVKSLHEKQNCKSIIIDLTETANIDSTSLGLLAKLSKHTQAQFKFCPTIVSTNEDVTRIIVKMGFKQIFTIISDYVPCSDKLEELPITSPCLSETDMCKTVIEAHRILMELNENNKAEFTSLVNTLEQGLGNDHQHTTNRSFSKHRPPTAA